MISENSIWDLSDATDKETSEPGVRPTETNEQPIKLTRLERLKLKIKKMQGSNPDIYPML